MTSSTPSPDCSAAATALNGLASAFSQLLSDLTGHILEELITETPEYPLFATGISELIQKASECLSKIHVI